MYSKSDIAEANATLQRMSADIDAWQEKMDGWQEKQDAEWEKWFGNWKREQTLMIWFYIPCAVVWSAMVGGAIGYLLFW